MTKTRTTGVLASGPALRDARQRNGLSQTALGAAAGVHQTTISQVEKVPSAYVRPETYKRITTALGVPYEALLATDKAAA